MNTDLIIEDEPPEIDDWFRACRDRLYHRWDSTTGHGGTRCSGRWACEIYSHCRTCDEHLSLPCSLAAEAEEIGLFLKSPDFSDRPVTFLRLFLILLSEFTGGLCDVAGLIGVKLGKPPKDVSVWCNRFAKHRLNILVQHHPLYVFADSYGEAWKAFEPMLPTKCLVDRCGNRRKLALIDYSWLTDSPRASDLTLANADAQAVIVVPPLIQFLDSTMDYFREFVDACVENSELVKRFESAHFNVGCF